jgi:hypothetical protein
VYDDTDYNGIPDGRVAIREGYIRSAYHESDAKLGRARALMAATRRHSPARTTASRRSGTPSMPARSCPTPGSNPGAAVQLSRADDHNLAKACGRRTAQIYVNTTLPSGQTYEAVRTQIINAFQNLTDPANPVTRSS